MASPTKECPECLGRGVTKFNILHRRRICPECTGTGRVPDTPVVKNDDQCHPDNCKARASHTCGTCKIFMHRVKNGLGLLLLEAKEDQFTARLHELKDLVEEQL